MSISSVKFIISEGIETQSNGIQQRQVIVNPLIILRTPFIPTAISLSLTIITAGVLLEGKPNSIEIQIKNVETGNIAYTSGNNEIMLPGRMDNFNFNADLKNISITKQGKYSAALIVNGKEFSDDFYIYKNETDIWKQ